MPPDDEPRIRPLPGPAPPLGPTPTGAWLVLATGVLGVVLGLIVGLNVGGDGEPATTTVTLAELPPDLAGSDLIDPSTTTSATTTTTTTLPPTTSTRADPAPPPTLAEMVPGLDGTMVVATTEEAWRWRLDEPTPQRFPMPPNTTWASFDSAGQWLAALAFPDSPLRAGAGLWLAGPDFQFQQFDAGVVSYRWHPVVAGRLAWVRSTLDGALELWTGEIPGPAEGLRRVATLGEAGTGAPLFLIDWGDWGFALSPGFTEDGTVLVATLGPDGRRIAEAGLDLVAARPDGVLLVAEPDPGPGPLPNVGVTGVDLADPEPVDWPVTRPALWSRGGALLATVTTDRIQRSDSTGIGAVLHISGAASFQTVIDSQFAAPLAWSPGDRFVVMWAPDVRTRFSADPDDPPSARESRRPALVFVDVADRSISAIAVDEPPTDVAFRVAS